MARKIISLVLSFGLLFQQISFAQVAAELNLGNYLSRISSNIVQDKFRPLHLRYFYYDSLNDYFKILLDKGGLQNLKATELESPTKTLLSYFLVGVTLPDDMFWVNLRPDSEGQIIDSYLEKTDVGRIMLEADLQLKKDTALFTSPQTPEGKEYWDKLYKKAADLYGYDNVTIPTLTRPWIVPGEIIVRESKDSAYVYKAALKVMLEQDYLKDSATYNFKDERSKALNEYSSQLIRELVIPKLTKEVNSSKRYAPLRQVYYSLILSRWFKLRFTGKTGTYAALINAKDLTNLISQKAWSKTDYFNHYKKSFQDGEYNIKEPVYTPTGQVIRSYFSGGINVAGSAIDTRNGVILTNDNAHRLGEVIGSKAVVDTRGISLRPDVAGLPNRVGSSPISVEEKSEIISRHVVEVISQDYFYYRLPEYARSILENVVKDLITGEEIEQKVNISFPEESLQEPYGQNGFVCEAIELTISKFGTQGEDFINNVIKVSGVAWNKGYKKYFEAPKWDREYKALLDSRSKLGKRAIYFYITLLEERDGLTWNYLGGKRIIEEFLRDDNITELRNLLKSATVTSGTLIPVLGNDSSTYYYHNEKAEFDSLFDEAVEIARKLERDDIIDLVKQRFWEIRAELERQERQKGSELYALKKSNRDDRDYGEDYNRLMHEETLARRTKVAVLNKIAQLEGYKNYYDKFYADEKKTNSSPIRNSSEGSVSSGININNINVEMYKEQLKPILQDANKNTIGRYGLYDSWIGAGVSWVEAGDEDSSSPLKTGGIDFRALPMTIQPMGSFNGLNYKLPHLSQAELRQFNIDSEMRQIKNMVSSGITPSGQRIKELVAACIQKKEMDSQASSALLCIADIFRLEEENASESSPELREALVIVDSQG